MTQTETDSEGHICHDCGHTHDDWEAIGGKRTVNSKHHSGWHQIIECGICGARDEVTGR